MSDCLFVSSIGLREICDIYPDGYTTIDDAIHQVNQKEQTTVILYVRMDDLLEFVYKIHLLEKPIVLVTGDNDQTIPMELIPSDVFDSFIHHDKIIHFFSQNCGIEHPKVTKIPIGMDYHTMRRREMWWGPQEPSKSQEEKMMEIQSKAKPFYERKKQCYSNFHFVDYGNRHGYSRKDVVGEIPRDVIYYEPTPITRVETFQHQCEYAFVVSPFGNGMDCHRTWESLILGCIVIVKKSVLDVLYENLPVLIVDQWTDITQELLEKTVLEYKNKTFDYDRLTLAYWRTNILERVLT